VPVDQESQSSQETVAKTVALLEHAVCRRTSADLTMLFDRVKGVMYELNESASAVVSVLTTEAQSVDAIVDQLLEQFEAPRNEVTADVLTFIRKFSEAGLLSTTQ
jgi:Coenzyme PQQ synthesis protein D (PqqD)